jgi:hypothetical protein
LNKVEQYAKFTGRFRLEVKNNKSILKRQNSMDDIYNQLNNINNEIKMTFQSLKRMNTTNELKNLDVLEKLYKMKEIFIKNGCNYTKNKDIIFKNKEEFNILMNDSINKILDGFIDEYIQFKYKETRRGFSIYQYLDNLKEQFKAKDKFMEIQCDFKNQFYPESEF